MSFEMKVAVGEGTRRLPVYLLLDCSGSMAGNSIQAVQHGLELFVREMMNDAFACQTVHVAIITFDSSAQMLTPGVVPIATVQIPTLNASGTTSLGAAFRLLQQSLDTDVVKSVKGGVKGDYKPLVFVLTDGQPTDDWRSAKQDIEARQDRKVINMITVGCGDGIDEQRLKEIAIGPTFKMDDRGASFIEFFKWASQVATTMTVSYQTGQENQPVAMTPPPNFILMS